MSRLRVRTPGLDAAVAGLSGGNQQKIVLARWLAARCRVLIISSELPEVIRLSTRVLVIREGRVVGELPREGLAQDALLRLMLSPGMERPLEPRGSSGP